MAGEEVGYLLAGTLQVKVEEAIQTLRAGDLMYLTSDFPSEWKNPGPDVARFLWIKVK